MHSVFLFLAAEAPAASGNVAGISWQTLAFIAGVIILAFMMPRLVRRATAERQEFIKQCSREIDGQQEIKSQADRIMVDLVEAGQEINAQLDTKMRVLNRLIRDAEQVAGRLEKQLERLEKSPLPAMGARADVPESAAKGYDPAKDTVLLEPAPGRPVINSENLEKPRNTDSGRWRNDICSKIEQHHLEHRTPTEIARMLHLSLSEVNLVIDMYEARHK